MRGTRRRREFAEHAERAGFGRIVRVHRQRRDLAVLPLVLTALAAVPAGFAAVYLAATGSPWWRPVVFGYAVAVWLVIGWAYWGPAKDPDGRHWFAAAEGGLLVTASAWAGPPLVVPWHSLRVETLTGMGTVVGHRLIWRDGNGDRPRQFDMAVLSGRGALIRAVKRGGPVPDRALRATRAVALGSITALVVWFAGVPIALDLLFGERPADIQSLSRICNGGAAFGRAAAYRGRGPHPVAVYEEDQMGDEPAYTDEGDHADSGTPKPGTVQLVGCVHRIGRVSDIPLQACGPYSASGVPVDGTGGYWYETYQGRYRIDLYEARTGHQVISVTINGSRKTGPCQPSIVVAPSTPENDSSDTTPDAAGYTARLSRLVDGRAGD